MPKGIREYFGKQNKNKTFIQGRVEQELYDAIKAILDREQISWSKYLEATGRQFVAEMNSPTPNRKAIQ